MCSAVHDTLKYQRVKPHNRWINAFQWVVYLHGCREIRKESWTQILPLGWLTAVVWLTLCGPSVAQFAIHIIVLLCTLTGQLDSTGQRFHLLPCVRLNVTPTECIYFRPSRGTVAHNIFPYWTCVRWTGGPTDHRCKNVHRKNFKNVKTRKNTSNKCCACHCLE